MRKHSKKLSKRVRLQNVILAHNRVIAAVVVILGIALIGYFGYFRSSAATYNSSYSVSVQSRHGCMLAGRVWDAEKDKCLAKCKVTKVEYVQPKGRPMQGHCVSYVAPEVTPEKCITDLHRYYIDNIGCSRRSDQENTNEAKQCIDGYPNYVADRDGRDKCIVPEIVHAQTGNGSGKVGSGTPSGAPAPVVNTPPATEQIGRASCRERVS
jgi:hypothetical protein